MPALAPPAITPRLRQIAPTDSSGRLSESILGDDSSESNYDDLVGLSDTEFGAIALNGSPAHALAAIQAFTANARVHNSAASFGNGTQASLSTSPTYSPVTVRSFTKQLASASKARVVSAEEVRKGTYRPSSSSSGGTGPSGTRKRGSSSATSTHRPYDVGRDRTSAAVEATSNSSLEASPAMSSNDVSFNNAGVGAASGSFDATALGVQSSRLLALNPAKQGTIVPAATGSSIGEGTMSASGSASSGLADITAVTVTSTSASSQPSAEILQVERTPLGPPGQKPTATPHQILAASRSNTQDSNGSSVAHLAYDPRPGASRKDSSSPSSLRTGAKSATPPSRSMSLDVPSDDGASGSTATRRSRKGSASQQDRNYPPVARNGPALPLSPVPPTPPSTYLQSTEGPFSDDEDEYGSSISQKPKPSSFRARSHSTAAPPVNGVMNTASRSATFPTLTNETAGAGPSNRSNLPVSELLSRSRSFSNARSLGHARGQSTSSSHTASSTSTKRRPRGYSTSAGTRPGTGAGSTTPIGDPDWEVGVWGASTIRVAPSAGENPSIVADSLTESPSMKKDIALPADSSRPNEPGAVDAAPLQRPQPVRKNSASARVAAIAAGAMKGLGFLSSGPLSPSAAPPPPSPTTSGHAKLKPTSGVRAGEDDSTQLSPPPLGASFGKDGPIKKAGTGFASFNFWSQQQPSVQTGSDTPGKTIPASPGTAGSMHLAFANGAPSSTGRRAEKVHKLLGRDQMLNRLLAEQARVDSENYPIMTLDEVQELKEEIWRLDKRIDEVKKKLGVETRIRDAAKALKKSHKRRSVAGANSSFGNRDAMTTPTSPEMSTGRLPPFPRKLPGSPQSPVSPAKSTRSGVGGAASPMEDRRIEENFKIANENVERVAHQLITMSETAGMLRRALLEHHAAVLAQRLDQMEEEQESTLVDSDAASLTGTAPTAKLVAQAAGAAAPSTEPAPATVPAGLSESAIVEQRHSMDLALRSAKERAEAVEHELELEKQASTRLQMQLDESIASAAALAAEASKTRESLAELNSIKESASVVERDLAESKERVSELEKHLKEAQHREAMREQQVQALEAARQAAEANVKNAEKSAEANVNVLQDRVITLASDLEKARSEAQSYQRQLEDGSAKERDSAASQMESVRSQVTLLEAKTKEANDEKAALSTRLEKAEKAAADAESRAFQAEAAAELERANIEESTAALKLERSRMEETLRTLQKEQLRADTAEHTLDEFRRNHEELTRSHAIVRSEAANHSATLETVKARAEQAEQALEEVNQQRDTNAAHEHEIMELKEALRKAERLATLQTEGLKGEQSMHATTKSKMEEHIELAKKHAARAEVAEKNCATQMQRAVKAEEDHAVQSKATQDALAKIDQERKRADEAEQSLRQIELAVSAERRIMTERDNLFHAFEQRLESAEARLRELDKRCGQVLGKLDGREEMDNLLEQIKRGNAGKKERSTAGQNIDSLITSVTEHVTDLVDEIDRLNGTRAGDGTNERGLVSSLSSRSLPASPDVEHKMDELGRAAQEAHERVEAERSEKEELQMQLSKLQGEFRNIQDIEIEVRNELVAAKEELQERDQKLRRLEIALQEASSAHGPDEDVVQLKEKLTNLQELNEQYVTKEKALTMQIDGLQEDLAASKTFVSEMHKRQSQASRGSLSSPRLAQSADSKKTVADLTQQLSSAQFELAQSQQKLAELKGELAGLRAQAERFATERLESQRKLEEARDSLAKSRLSGASDLAAQKLVLELRTRCSQLTSEYASAQVALDNAEKEAALWKSKAASAESQLSTSKPSSDVPVAQPVADELQRLAALFPDAIQSASAQVTPKSPSRSTPTRTSIPSRIPKKATGLAELRAKFEQQSNPAPSAPVKAAPASNSRSPAEPAADTKPAVTLVWTSIIKEVTNLRSTLASMKVETEGWQAERTRLTKQVEAMKDAKDSAELLLEQARKTHELELSTSTNDHGDLQAKVTQLEGELKEAQHSLDDAITALKEANIEKERAQQAAAAAAAVTSSSPTRLAATRGEQTSSGTPSRSPRKQLMLEPIAATTNQVDLAASPLSAQTLELPSSPLSQLRALSPSPNSPISDMGPSVPPKGPVLRTMTLGMNPAQLTKRVRELEDELRRVPIGPRQASPMGDTQLVVRLEEELEEVKDELLAAREELDELKAVQTKQRIQLLDEMNTLQEELATVRAKLRMEQRRRAREPTGPAEAPNNTTAPNVSAANTQTAPEQLSRQMSM